MARLLDRRGFSEAYRRWLPFVRRAVARQSVRPDDVDDVSQEVFVLMLRKLAGSPRDDDNVRGWLYETARRVANNHRRGRGRHERKVAAVREVTEHAAAQWHVDGHAALIRLQRVVAEFTPAERVAFEQAIVAGRPGRDIAATLGIKQHAAYGLINRVRRRIDGAIDPRDERRGMLSVLFGWWHQVCASAVAQGFPGAVASLAVMSVVVVPPASSPPSVATPSTAVQASLAPVRSVLDDAAALRAADAPLVLAEVAPSDADGSVDPATDIDIVIELDEPPRRRAGSIAVADAEPVDTLRQALEDFVPAAAEPTLGDPDRDGPLPVASARRAVAAPIPVAAPSRSPKGYWRGRITHKDGSPVVDAAVRCRQRDDRGRRRRCFGRGQQPPRTDAMGRVVVGPLPSGDYELTPFESGAVAAADETFVVSVR